MKRQSKLPNRVRRGFYVSVLDTLEHPTYMNNPGSPNDCGPITQVAISTRLMESVFSSVGVIDNQRRLLVYYIMVFGCQKTMPV